jgi:hypothetical protein
MEWWQIRNHAGDALLPKHATMFEGEGGGEGGGGGGSFDPKSVPQEWLNAQVQNAIAKATGGKGLDGLLNNNKELLSEKKRLQEEYQSLQEKLKPLGDLDQATELFKKFNDDEELKLFKEGKVDDLVKRKTNEMVKRHQKDIEEWQRKDSQREQREKTLMQRLQAATIDRELTEAAAKAGVHKSAIPDLINRGRGVYRLEESGDDFQMIPKDAEGQIIFGKDGKTPLSPEEWVESLKDSAPHFFPGSSGGGATGGPGKGGGSAIVLPRNHSQAEFEAAYAQARKEGKELKIAAS